MNKKNKNILKASRGLHCITFAFKLAHRVVHTTTTTYSLTPAGCVLVAVSAVIIFIFFLFFFFFLSLWWWTWHAFYNKATTTTKNAVARKEVEKSINLRPTYISKLINYKWNAIDCWLFLKGKTSIRLSMPIICCGTRVLCCVASFSSFCCCCSWKSESNSKEKKLYIVRIGFYF